MSLLTTDEAVAAGIGSHLSAEALQAAINEEEAWLARKLGGAPLTGERTESFPLSYLRVRSHEVRLARPADPEADLEVLSDGTDISDTVELRNGNRRVALVVADGIASRISGAWAVTYTPGDELEVKRALKFLLAMTLGVQGGSGLQSEIIGSYSYTRAAGSATALRRSIVRELRGEPTAGSMRILSSVRHGLAGVLDR